MQVWLDPITMFDDFDRAVPAVITRIKKASEDAGFRSLNLDDILHQSCLLNLKPWNSDPDVYAAEVVRLERNRLGFYDRLKYALDEINHAAGDIVDWCLPFIDYDIYFMDHDKFVTNLSKFPYLECYLSLADADSPLAQNWRGNRNVKIVTDDTLRMMAPTLGFSSPLVLPSPPPSVTMSPGPSSPSQYDAWLDEDEEVEKPKPKPKKKYRSIDDD